jgi:TonB family protein
VLFFNFVLHNKKSSSVCLSAPIEVSFYSSKCVSSLKEKKEISPIIVHKQMKEENRIKNGVTVKNKNLTGKIIEKKLETKTNVKKMTTQSSGCNIKEEKFEMSTFSENNKNIGTSELIDSRKLSNGMYSQHEGLSFDTQNFKYFYYADQVIRKIKNQWKWIEDCNEKLKTLVYFKIHKNGMVSDILIKESSGNIEYDKNALNTVYRSVPFPDLPKGYEDEFLGVLFEFKYRN